MSDLVVKDGVLDWLSQDLSHAQGEWEYSWSQLDGGMGVAQAEWSGQAASAADSTYGSLSRSGQDLSLMLMEIIAAVRYADDLYAAAERQVASMWSL
ncbi:WXG100 family type VII secretion target [Actinomyces ruminis]|uniref:WXG100 family type VII secretion target n=1 Tax=Actinomyces ruminis TaxID=1937003 RepID=A0ABX4M8P3_9ACTO|nr:WXG100 family type VII secretion target [Actinomyces ruminis]PHP51786.1 hypothetical protein BW737_014395 [Actinomyces ruminis]